MKPTTPLKVLLVSRSQSMLVSLSKFLDLLGMAPLEVVEPRQAAEAAASERPDMLILDAELLPHGGRELCRAVCGGGMRNHVFTLLLVEEPAGLEALVEALKLGVDDFLSKPIIFGELLARLRAAARGLEYERRVTDYLGTDPLVGLPNANAFRQALRAALNRPSSAGSSACVALDLDFFNRLNYMYGKPEADEALRSIAKLLEKACHTNDLAATCGDDRFLVLLPDRTEAEAGYWAEQLRATLAEAQITLGVASEAITASFGVAAAEAGSMSADELLKRAEEALQAAKRSGRNCVVLRSALDDESNAWTNLGAPGKLFDRTLARDVMAPCTVHLREDDTMSHAVAVFQRTGQTAIPVVNREGKLTGLMTAENLHNNPTDEHSSAAVLVRNVMTADPVQFDEEATFARLVSFFSEFERSLAVVVAEGERPTGIVTRTGLAALSEPLTADSFAPEEGQQSTSEYLVVRDA
jgi:diguanylate cyclase (GGDEF)-like protein